MIICGYTIFNQQSVTSTFVSIFKTLPMVMAVTSLKIGNQLILIIVNYSYYLYILGKYYCCNHKQ